jgi:hypothetical protein
VIGDGFLEQLQEQALAVTPLPEIPTASGGRGA